MLHELLLALSGVSGDLFVPYPPEPEKPVLFKIPPDFPFLHEAERTSLERLAVLGFHYRCINKFLGACLGRRSESESSPRNVLRGSFVHALCNAINDVLGDYQKLVMESEQKILNNEDNMGGVVPISHFTSVFAEYHIILPQLCALVNEIEANPEKYLGCRILNLLVEKCNTGVPQLREVMLKLVHACHGVMYQHITSWMVYGHLQDALGEFFIKDQTPQLQQEHAQQTPEDNYSKTRWHQRFTLDETLLPNHIPRDIAESILFVGKAIATVKNAQRPGQGKSMMMPRSLSLSHLQYLLELSSKATFHHAELKNVVATIRTSVAEWLWQAVLTGDKVIECLMGFRNYFLLGQGDFALSLIDEFEKLAASRLTAKRAATIKEQGLNTLFVRASVGTLAENDLVLEKFRFKLASSNENSNLPSLNIFDDVVIGAPLRLEYEITWPLNLFVTTEDLSKYGDLFSFLISLRRTQHRLHKAWAHLSTVQKCTLRVSQDKKSESLIWKARTSMLFFIDCLWGHVQSDIIESSFQKLVHQIAVSSARHNPVEQATSSVPPSPTSSTKSEVERTKEEMRADKTETLCDFEDIRTGHATYLGEILRGCLLESRVCSETIKKALHICDQLCGILMRWDGTEDKENLRQIASLDAKFHEQVSFLFRTLSGINKTRDGFGGPPRHLDQLLFRLDYSKWFSVWVN